MINTKRFLLLGLFLLFSLQSGFAAENLIAGYTAEQALQFGEQMYRQGLLPSGEPMSAYVHEDILVEGTMFSCESCHLRSGLGSAEGTIITLPTNGAKLFNPLHRGTEIETKPARAQLAKPFQSKDVRPGYTEEKLREAIWAGVDPGGRELNWTMPRYDLTPDDMEILIYYLKNLSVEYSPGVDDQTLTFATVVTDDVSQADRQAFLGALQAYINDRNSQNRHETRRSQHGPFYKQDLYTAYRRLELRIWDLSGPPSTWKDQLEAYYREKPVFALIGGVSNQSWEPIHRFSEQKRLPCLLPQTPFPVIEKNSWYTLYFSKGYYQEGEATAQFLRPEHKTAPPTVIQVVRNRPESLALKRGFTEAWQRYGYPTPPTITIDSAVPLSDSDWLKLTEQYPKATILVWLAPEDFVHIGQLGQEATLPSGLIFSSTLMREEFNKIPER